MIWGVGAASREGELDPELWYGMVPPELPVVPDVLGGKVTDG